MAELRANHESRVREGLRTGIKVSALEMKAGTTVEERRFERRVRQQKQFGL